jgi:hypothetical protein
MGAGIVSTRNIVTSLAQLPQQWRRRQRFSLTRDQVQLSIGWRSACQLRNVAGVAGFDRDDGATAGFHCPFQPFDGFIDPLVVVLGIGDRLFPECICLMKARGSAIHAALPIRRFRPDRILDDRRAGVVNIGQEPPPKKKAPAGTDRLGLSCSQTSSLGLGQVIRIVPIRSRTRSVQFGTFFLRCD